MRGIFGPVILLPLFGCAAAPSTPTASAGQSVVAPAQSVGSLLDQGERALADDPARAASFFSRAVGAAETQDEFRRAYGGLGRAQEALGDYEAASRAYDGFLKHEPEPADRSEALARRGAIEAELGLWDESAATYAEVAESKGLPAPAQVEALTREGFALFQLGDLDEADEVLARADTIYEEQRDAERFDTFYFVGMARFYRGGVQHRRFRDVEIALPETRMTEGFNRKLELLTKAQELYNEAIRAKHVFWVSAAGYQLGSLFEEFYDSLMHAPVPQWLDEGQREVYYEELKSQLRPVVDKAIWVFEKNLETAQRLGYDNDFVDRTREQLAQLQTLLMSDDAHLGKPHPRLAPAHARPIGPEGGEGQGAAAEPLFVPAPTPL